MVIYENIIYSNTPCKCGCGEFPKQNKNYIHGHSRKGKKRTDEQNRKISKTRIKNEVAKGKKNPSYKHGMNKTRLYEIWQGIKSRCLNPNKKRFKDYGGRGITICPEWLEFIPFMDWSLSNGYQEDLTIDRIENDGNYEPNNCQWLTYIENNRKQKQIKLSLEQANEIRIKYNSGYYIQKHLAEEYNVSQVLISAIITNKIWNNI